MAKRGTPSPKRSAIVATDNRGRRPRPVAGASEAGAAGDRPIRAFISYAHADLRMLEALLVHLDHLTRAFRITFWHDESIEAGNHFDATIEAAINDAHLFLVLVSPASLASAFIRNRELPAIVQRSNAVGGKVVPIVLSSCPWQDLVGRVQALPLRGRRLKPITEWPRQNDGHAEAVAQLHRDVATHFRLTAANASPLDALIGARNPPGGVVMEPVDGQLDLITEGADADFAAATRPEVQALHAATRQAAAAFLDRVQRLGNRLDTDWEDLIPAAQALADALNRPLPSLPEDVVGLWAASTSLASFLDMDRDLRNRQSRDPDPLPPATARALSALVNLTAPFVREFPSARAMDDNRGGFFAHPELLDPAAENLRIARERHILTETAGQTLAQTLNAARRDPAQGAKAGAYGLSGTQAMLTRGSSFVAEHDLTTDVTPARQEFETQFEAYLQQARPVLASLLATMAPDIGHAIETLAARAGTDAFPGKGRKPGDVRSASGIAHSAELRLKPLSRWRDRIPGLPEAACPEMITLPEGTFTMGAPKSEAQSGDNERPQREVTVPIVALGRCAVTFAQWDAARKAGAKLRNPDDEGRGRGDHPVINVSWNDAQAYCAWLNDRLGLTKENGYRLPSEAEWEYACRAGTITPFSFGATISTDQVNYDGNYTYGAGRNGEYRKRTVPVGSLPANAWGLHEMHGNVWEWCEDWYGPYPNHATDAGPLQHPDGKWRVLRGGCWDGGPWDARSATRDSRGGGGGRSSWAGFRLARTPGSFSRA